MKNWTPLDDKIIVERIAEDPLSATIILPDSAKDKSHRGVIVATGPGRWIEGINGGMVRQRLEVKAGDVVRFSLTDWESLDGEHVIIQEGDIFFVEKLKALSA